MAAARSAEEVSGLCRRHVGTVYRICLMLLKSVPDAEDAVQTVFRKLLEYSGTFESPEHEKAWLIVTARNECKNQLRHWRRTRRAGSAELEDMAWEAPADGELWELILSLPEREKMAVYLHYYQGYSTGEAAALMGAKPATFRSWLYRARRRLKDLWEEDWDIRHSSWVPKWEMVEDEAPSDGRITMILTLSPMSGGEQLSGRRLLLVFRRLCAAESWEKAIRGERTVVVDGLWYFPMFTLPEEDPGVTYEIDQPVALWDDSRVTLDAVYVSPISLGCDLSDGADSLLELDGTREAEWADSVALVTKKGERIPVVDAFQPVTGVEYSDDITSEKQCGKMMQEMVK